MNRKMMVQGQMMVMGIHIHIAITTDIDSK